MKERIAQLKAVVSKLDSKMKKTILAGVAGLIVFSIAVALLLNRDRGYEVLFSNLGTEEAQQIIGKLQESQIDYQYTKNGEILVPSNVLDQTRANLAFEGYPKNGFGYQVFTENAGLMTTDSDKNRYAIYDLQNRIAATIMLFDGVRDAHVTIAMGEERKYVLSDENVQQTTANAVVTMADGGSPSVEQALAVQRLVASGVPGLDPENVAVFDGNGNDVSTSEEDNKSLTSQDTEEIARLIEGQITAKVLHVLAPFYGEGNVRVSTKAQINMETLLRETITYNTPEKIDPNDKTGIISHEQGTVEISGEKDAVAGGVAGAESNADTSVPEYNTGGDDEDAQGYGARTWDRDFLVNQIKEQGQVTPGALEDLSVSVAINGESYGSLTIDDLRSLVGNAAGIAEADWVSKISVVSGVFYESYDNTEPEEEKGAFAKMVSSPVFFIVLAVVLVLLIVAVVLLVLSSKKKKKKKKEEEDALAAEAAALAEQLPSFNPEIINLQNDKGMELKQNIREFTEENPEIAAQLLKNWLNGGVGEK